MDDHAVLWHIFSHVVKLHLTVELEGRRTDKKALYDFHEAIVEELRPALKEEVRSVIVAAPVRTTYAADFLDHVRKHHAYLIQAKGSNRATFAELVGTASQLHEVAELVKTKEFCKLIAETTSREADRTVDTLEKHLNSIDNSSVVLYSPKEIEDFICDQERQDDFGTKYLILTDKYLTNCKDKNRINRLLQISKNKKVKTRIVNEETPAGKRISQLGGIIFFTAQIM
jgi:stalled ribosome rescue protein Dom34